MTAQTPDVLLFEGRELPLFSNPLEALWDEAHPRPMFLPASTALWRGYVATWAIEDGRLYLKGVEGFVRLDNRGGLAYGKPDVIHESVGSPTITARDVATEFVAAQTEIPRPTAARPISLRLLFPDASDRVLATWFSGELRAPEGELVRYVHMGYGSVYEREMQLTVERGLVIETRSIETGEKYLSELQALKVRLEERLPAAPSPDGRVVCPHCGKWFEIRNKKRWDGERHLACGGRISLSAGG